MDTEKVKDHVRLRFDHAVQKKIVRERMQQKMVIACDGGLFKITPELITFMDSIYHTLTPTKELIIEDLNGNPIKIEDPGAFHHDCKERYREVMNEWHMEYERMKRVRKVENLVK